MRGVRILESILAGLDRRHEIVAVQPHLAGGAMLLEAHGWDARGGGESERARGCGAWRGLE